MSAIEKSSKGLTVEALMADGMSEAEARDFLEPSTAGKMTASTGGATQVKVRRTKPVNTAPAENGLTLLGRNAQEEVNSIRDALQAGADQFVEATAADLIDVVSSTPARVLSRVAEMAEESQADPATFRDAGDRVSKAIFGVG